MNDLMVESGTSHVDVAMQAMNLRDDQTCRVLISHLGIDSFNPYDSYIAIRLRLSNCPIALINQRRPYKVLSSDGYHCCEHNSCITWRRPLFVIGFKAISFFIIVSMLLLGVYSQSVGEVSVASNLARCFLGAGAFALARPML